MTEIISCWSAVIFLGLCNLGLVAMFLNYRTQIEKWKLTLEKNDKEQNEHICGQEKDIKELKDKNGDEQRQIDRLRGKVESLEHIIKTALNKESKAPEVLKKETMPTPPPPPLFKTKQTVEPKKENKPEKIELKDHNQVLKEALDKRRKKIEDEDEERNN